LWQPDPVQSEAKSWAGGLALKFSPREVPCGASCARACGTGHSVRAAAATTAQHKEFGRVRRFIVDNDDLHAGAKGARPKNESGV
jgi:hypothetical protein